jgi:lysozyme
MIGRYGDEEPFIKGRGTYTIWQKSQTGRLAGIAKNVDINVFRKDKSINDISLGR